jgi:hypothetical protein
LCHFLFQLIQKITQEGRNDAKKSNSAFAGAHHNSSEPIWLQHVPKTWKNHPIYRSAEQRPSG